MRCRARSLRARVAKSGDGLAKKYRALGVPAHGTRFAHRDRMDFKRITPLAACAALFSLASVAHGDWTWTGSTSTTGVSGYAGTGVTKELLGINAITWGEYAGSTTCQLWTGLIPLPPVQACLGTKLLKQVKHEVKLSGPDWVARGIQVCTDNSGNSASNGIHGIKLFAAKLDQVNGTVTALPNSELRKTSRCKKWHTARFCPAGQMAKGIVAHQNGKEYRGIALRCSRIRKR